MSGIGESRHYIVKDNVDQEPVWEDDVHDGPEDVGLVVDVWEDTHVERHHHHGSQENNCRHHHL